VGTVAFAHPPFCFTFKKNYLNGGIFAVLFLRVYPVELVICCSDSIEAIVLLKLASGSTKLLSETMLSSSVSFSFPIPMPNLVWRSFLRLMRFLTFLPKSISFSL